MKRNRWLSWLIVVLVLAVSLGTQEQTKAIPTRSEFDLRILAAVWQNFLTTRDKTPFASSVHVAIGREKCILSIPTLTNGSDQLEFHILRFRSDHSGRTYNTTGVATTTVNGDYYAFRVTGVMRLQKIRDGKWVVTVQIGGKALTDSDTFVRARMRGVGPVSGAS